MRRTPHLLRALSALAAEGYPCLVGGLSGDRRARLAELVAALSLGVDLGFGQPMEHVLRQCIISLRLADCARLGEQDRVAVYYTALLINVGCHSDAHEQAKWFGDDITLKSGKYAYEFRSVRGALASMRLVGAGNPPLHRFRVGLEFAFSGHRELDGMIVQHARLARTLAEQLGLPDAVREGVGTAYEQWDGRGWPGDLKSDAIPVAARIAQLAEFTEVAHRVGGVAAATTLARKRAGRQFDPALADLLCARAGEIFGGLDAVPAWRTVIAAEPALAVELSEEQLDGALAAIANFIDLKSPYTLGHSVAVAELAEEAGGRLGLPPEQALTLRRAGFVHGFGRLGVSNSIWDRPGPLSAGEWERVRMYPYLTERMLHQSAALAPLGEIAVQHRERLDGTGYPRGLAGGAISRLARVLAAADVYVSMLEPRPHRRARLPGEAAEEMRAEVRAGRLDGSAVDAVLEAAGHRQPRRRQAIAGLTAREVEVLILLARGMSNKQIAEHLVVTPKTAGNHIEHIYAKIGASSRTAAAMFAVQHGLLPEDNAASAARAPG
jgi:HD-GYP domain-containing protein (c-di-GMP phosphodiesterase class II)